MMAHEHDWLTPSVFWSSTDYGQVEFYRPALFEFRSDEFMEEFFAAVVDPNPEVLQNARLQPPDDEGKPNKLFQPAHGCFYLAAASLCCREPGFPDRQVRRADDEAVSFVLRKLVHGKEYGWVVTQDSKSWKLLIDTGRTVLENEERLPVFPVPLCCGRSIYCGYVPASSSQMYDIPPEKLEVEGEDPQKLDILIQELSSRFTSSLIRNSGNGDTDPTKNLVDSLPNNAAWTTSVYLLVELWEFLMNNLPEVAEAIRTQTSPSFGGDKANEKTALLAFLQNRVYKGSLHLADALQAVAQNYKDLNASGGGDLNALGFAQLSYSLRGNATPTDQVLRDLLDHVAAALPDERPPLAVPKLDISSTVQYVLRFVYDRPLCPQRPVEVSFPSQPFTFAPFFDPDAPGRPVRIPLPSDISIAGMRKFKKNVTFMMSEAMHKKMASIIGKEREILDDPNVTLTESSGAYAYVCSFSIQIIFIVAFVLLLIFVVVFNIIFWWLAFFKICLPVPKDLLPE